MVNFGNLRPDPFLVILKKWRISAVFTRFYAVEALKNRGFPRFLW